jgi:hypothetical protein
MVTTFKFFENAGFQADRFDQGISPCDEFFKFFFAEKLTR